LKLPSDPALSVSGNLYETRSENWSRGAKTLDFLKGSLSKRFNKYDFEKLILGSGPIKCIVGSLVFEDSAARATMIQ